MPANWKLLCAAVILGGLASVSPAASISGTFNSAPPAENLTTDGNVDWAAWNLSTTAPLSSTDPAVRKSGSPLDISTVTIVGDTGAAGVGSPGSESYTWSNGTSAAPTFGPATINLIKNTTNATLNAGVSFTITGDPTRPETAYVFVEGGNSAVGTLKATLNNTGGYSPTGHTYPAASGGTYSSALYAITFQPDQASDLLTIKFVNTASAANSFVGLQAVALSVPEPATVGLLALSVGLLIRRRRGFAGNPSPVQD